jgi:hypothetical protein
MRASPRSIRGARAAGAGRSGRKRVLERGSGLTRMGREAPGIWGETEARRRRHRCRRRSRISSSAFPVLKLTDSSVPRLWTRVRLQKSTTASAETMGNQSRRRGISAGVRGCRSTGWTSAGGGARSGEITWRCSRSPQEDRRPRCADALAWRQGLCARAITPRRLPIEQTDLDLLWAGHKSAREKADRRRSTTTATRSSSWGRIDDCLSQRSGEMLTPGVPHSICGAGGAAHSRIGRLRRAEGCSYGDSARHLQKRRWRCSCRRGRARRG